jgi:hypothetical protein
VDLDAATIVCAIYGDDVLTAGHVILPMEAIAWFGFPETQVNVGVRFVGFHLPKLQKKPLVVKDEARRIAKKSPPKALPD